MIHNAIDITSLTDMPNASSITNIILLNEQNIIYKFRDA